MITDKETNTIYFSEILKMYSHFSEVTSRVTGILDSFNVKYKFLRKTNDIWVRDYMPIQVSDSKYIEYRYDPDYLQGQEKDCRNLKTYPDVVCNSIGLNTQKSELILDGGNVVKSSDYVILTDKIINENKHSYSKTELVQELRNMFEVDYVVLIPWDKKEKYGHADGMIRFIDKKTVLINHIYQKDSTLLYLLKRSGLRYEFLDFKVKKQNKYNWAYINFLQTKDLILLPVVDAEEDQQAFSQIEQLYPEYKNRIIAIELNDIIQLDGALNCITWTTKE